MGLSKIKEMSTILLVAKKLKHVKKRIGRYVGIW